MRTKGTTNPPKFNVGEVVAIRQRVSGLPSRRETVVAQMGYGPYRTSWGANTHEHCYKIHIAGTVRSPALVFGNPAFSRSRCSIRSRLRPAIRGTRSWGLLRGRRHGKDRLVAKKRKRKNLSKRLPRPNFHRPLVHAMRALDLTEKEVADKTGLSLYQVRLVLSGNHRATLRAMASVAHVLGYRLELNIHKPSLLEKLARAADGEAPEDEDLEV